MAYNSGKGTDGAGATSTGINSISLPWTTDVQPRTGAIDAAYSNDNPYYLVHGYQPIGRQRDIAPHYPTTETSLSHECYDWTGGLLGASSTLALPGADGAAQPPVLEDDLSWSQFQAYAGESEDLPPMLHQDPWHMLNFLGDADLEACLTEGITDFTVPGPSSSATCLHAEAGVSAEAEAGPSSEVFSASGHDSLHTALDSPAEGSSKERKRALDLDSDTEDGPRLFARSPKKRRIRDFSLAPTANSEPGDIAEGSSTLNMVQIAKGKTVKNKKSLEVRAQSSSDYRGRISSGIDSLRERVFPGSVKPGMRRRKSHDAPDGEGHRDKNNETSELQVILKAREEIDEARAMIKKLQDDIEDVKGDNEKLRDDMKSLRDNFAAAEQQNLYLRMWIDCNGEGSHGTR